MDPKSPQKHELCDEEVRTQTILSKLPDEERSRVQPIFELQKQRNRIYIQYQLELRELQNRYERSYTPLYRERASYAAHLPGFWYQVLKNNSVASNHITARDEKLLNHISDIRYIRDPGSDSFVLEFEFIPNDYIENKVLSKRYLLSNESMMERAEGTSIIWKGENFTQKLRKHKTDDEYVDCPSFFNFFKSVTMPGALELEEMDEQLESELCNSMEQDFDLACELRDEIIPNAVGYYLKQYKTELEDSEEEEEIKKKPLRVDSSGAERAECRNQ
jgi:hypothetical protein